jgi:hypothetical protein
MKESLQSRSMGELNKQSEVDILASHFANILNFQYGFYRGMHRLPAMKSDTSA